MKRTALALFIFIIFLTGCTTTINNYADELTTHKWKSSFENNTTVELSFTDDNAKMILTTSDKNVVTISGLCEISNTQFVIHDKLTATPYAFEYVVHFDCVDIIYDKNCLTLKKL